MEANRRFICCIIVHRQYDQQTAYVVFEQAHARHVFALGGVIEAVIGSDALVAGTLPETSRNPMLTLGGDYPGLFVHLAAYARENPMEAVWSEWRRGLSFIVWPNQEDEPYGMAGMYDGEEYCRVVFFSSTDAGIRLLHENDRDVGQHQRFIDRCVLPQQSGQCNVLLDPALSAWLLMYYMAYRADTGEIR